MWDQRYDTEQYVYGTEPNAFLASVSDRIPPGRVLSLAEGEGRNAVFLARSGYDVVGVDSSRVGLDKARRLAEQSNVHVSTVHSDLAFYAITPNSWDGIVSIFCHLPPGIRVPLHASVVSGLTAGGMFILEAYTLRQLAYGTGGPRSVERLVALADLRRELNGLEFIIAQEKERDVREGSYHTGVGHVVQVLAMKPQG